MLASFLCPLTHEIMMDPVMCSDGHSYEREAIGQYLRRGNNMSPVDNSVAITNRLIPNVALRGVNGSLKPLRYSV